jgi:2-oxo-4-hydroxy-4-carboxy-5-ureidoimidazoline decarboxylase
MLAQFNALPADDAQRQLLHCCAAPAWVRPVVAERPYPDETALLRAAERAMQNLPWSSVEAAVDAHPRIGQPPAGSGRDARASRREQSGTAADDEATRAALADVNRAYEQRFGHRFLIYASGRSGAEMVAAARERLGNDPDTERGEVRRELSKITLARLRALLSG